MSPPINIDGSEIQDATIDGQDVSEITIDGQQAADLNVIPDSGVSRYRFEQDVTDSWGSNDATDNTSAGYLTGQVGDFAKDFDGTDDDVRLPFTTVNYPFSISIWVYPRDITTAQMIFGNYANTPDDLSLGHSNNFNGNVYLGFDDFSYSGQGSETLTESAWNHVVLTIDSSPFATIYVNNTVHNSISGSGGSADNGRQFRFGARANSLFYYDGRLNDARLYDKELSASEVNSLFNGGSI